MPEPATLPRHAAHDFALDASAAASGEEAVSDRLSLHLPLVAALGGPNDGSRRRPSRPGRAGWRDDDAIDLDHPKAVLELPVPERARHFFGDPIAGVEAACARGVRKLVREAGNNCTHFALRWLGLAAFAGVGATAGVARVRGRTSIFNADGRRRPRSGWCLLALSLPVPVLPLIGAAVGEGVAGLACRGLEPVGHDSKTAASRRAGGRL